MIEYSTVKIYLLEHWLEALLIGVLVLVAGGIFYYNYGQLAQKNQFLEQVDAVRREKWEPPETPAAPPGNIYNRMLVVEPELTIFLRDEIPPVHFWGEAVNVLGLKTPDISLQEASVYVGPSE